MFFIFDTASLFAQHRITGVVRDKTNNRPLEGATVLIWNEGVNAITNAEGEFSIVIPDKDITLITSFVGYTVDTTLVANGQAGVLIALNPSLTSQLNNVVVMGYTSKQQSHISGSVAVVSGEQLNDVTSNNVTNLLQGKVPGVIVSNGAGGNPNTPPAAIIRGSGSISAGAAPLYVVDGIIGGMVNPNDVESVTILKDAAVTGLYGSRASNGVIIITTKTGKGKTRVDLSSRVGFNKITTGRFDIMNAQQLYDYQKTFLNPADFDRVRPVSLLQQNTDWLGIAFRTGITQNHALSVSGGSEKTQFYTSLNYYQEQGTLEHNGTQKYNLRTNISYKINDKLKMHVRFNGGFGKSEEEASGGMGALYGAFTNMPWDNPFNADGSIRMGTEPGWIGREKNNFLHGWQYNFNKMKQADVTGDLVLVYKLSQHFTLSTFNRAAYSDSKNVVYADVKSKAGLAANGSLVNVFNTSSGLITSNRLEYQNNFGKHNLDVLAVAEMERNYSDNNSITGWGLPSGLAVMDVASTILNAGGNTGENVFSKELVQADYNYDNRYFAVGSFINESSSRFGSNNRSAGFYTLSGAWILSNENFMRDQRIFDLIKIRMSYGSSGNAQIGNYQSLGLYTFSASYSGITASVPLQMANHDLSWEKAKTTNFGIDISLFERVSVSVDWYDKTTDALLLNVPLPYTSGYSSIIQNVGSVKNRGIEINLNTNNLTGALKWRTNFNIAFNHNKVLALYQHTDIVSGSHNISEGRDLSSWYMRKWVGVDPENGDPLWEKLAIDADNHSIITQTNSYNEATQQFTGKASPDFTGGFINTFSYRGFALNAFFNFVSGNKVYNASREFFDSDGSYQTYNSMNLIEGWTRWQEPGDVATHPKSVEGGNRFSNRPSSRYLEDGSYIRLRNVSLSYQLSDQLLNKLRISNARLFVSGDNLWTGTRFSGMDPEVLLSSSGGISRFTYPNSRRIIVGLNVKF
ncbi:SusC/RagA family TonB-linked outer membrane protein [Niabella aurantiaca]|uniref:SusC/RagA family TonB-linked outer membrane protein n=1 Tax=Niabella aurantiaca TaxID=379900 RepID=UPI000371D96D|nr:SusC/RagA family TonB-linked outer membrane protein [Niabella aurantiaca]